ncbi:hypothetical protein [Hymenobacter jejuensis]|uniref:PorT family protein n=1 Tax=Hymenobacter jejuensis TaxID=2502781 RepID=A0A5B7ZZT7_9BACT|nr:hypothetical protein [Hymenobacter jejuensis]QDA60671.1 hypothetical protein FHG12_11405 [Hymenobacter jejuensis]
MGLSANNNTPDPQSTGDLEHLFRQKFADAEVAPRFQLWEQLDHELLVRQNETYRRRLLLHRWLAAACVLFMLSVGGWFGLRSGRSLAPQGELASQRTAPEATTAAGILGAKTDAATAHVADRAPAGASYAVSAPESGTQTDSDAANALAVQAGSPAGTTFLSPAMGEETNILQAFDSQSFVSGRKARAVGGNSASTSAFASDAASVNGNGASLLARQVNALLSDFATASVAFLRPDTLKPALQTTPPAVAKSATDWASVEEEEKPRSKTGRWRVGGSYGAASYNPNINFSGGAVASSNLSYSAAPTVAADYRNASNLYEAGAQEYRRNLRPGPAQRATLSVSYALNKRWVLLTGMEAARQEASSKTSYAFANNTTAAFAGKSATVSNQAAVPYMAYSQVSMPYGQQRTTRYRYQTASVPMAVRYGSPKTGISLYAKVGAVVGVLLSSRTEVEGAPSLTREDTFKSSDSPYRKVLAAVRGGAGMQYRPADATWTLAVGPSAESGLNSLNANPMHASRPYSVGMEASVEFGNTKAAPIAR